MAADLRLVVHAPQADPRELAAHGAGDRLAERGLADAGRPDEAQDRRLAFGRQLAHRQILDDALLDLLQAVVIRIEDAACLGDVDVLRLGRRPGQLDQRVEVGADHAVFGRRLGRTHQAAQFLARRGLDLGRHPGLDDRLLEVGQVLLVGAFVAQLALDGSHLLAQQHLALARVERGLGLPADLGRQAQDFQAMGQKLGNLVEPRHQVGGLEDVLLLRRRGVEIGDGEVGQHAGRAGRLHGLAQLRRHARQQVEDFAHLLLQHVEACLDLRRGRGRLGEMQAPGQQERVAFDELGNAEALDALADQVMAALGAGDVAHDVGDRADAVEVVRPGIVLLGVALQHDDDLALLAHRLLRGRDGRRTAQRDREHDLGKENGVAHRHDDQRIGGQRSRRLAGRTGAGIDVGRAHDLALCDAALGSLITRQPWATPLRGVP